MIIGMSTAIFWDYEKLDLSEAVSRAVGDLNFEGVEVHCENPLFDGWGDDFSETLEVLGKSLDSWDVPVSLHAPYHDANIATLNHDIGEVVMKQNKDCIDVAEELGAEIVVIHPGFVSSRKFKREKCFYKMVSRLTKLCDYASDRDVMLTIENLASKKKAMGVKSSEVLRIFEEVNCDNLGLTLDIAHANTVEEGPVEFAKNVKPFVEHLHVSDNVGSDDHLSVGQGDIDFREVFEVLMPFDGMAVVEGWIPEKEDPFLKIGREKLESFRDDL